MDAARAGHPPSVAHTASAQARAPKVPVCCAFPRADSNATPHAGSGWPPETHGHRSRRDARTGRQASPQSGDMQSADPPPPAADREHAGSQTCSLLGSAIPRPLEIAHSGGQRADVHRHSGLPHVSMPARPPATPHARPRAAAPRPLRTLPASAACSVLRRAGRKRTAPRGQAEHAALRTYPPPLRRADRTLQTAGCGRPARKHAPTTGNRPASHPGSSDCRSCR